MNKPTVFLSHSSKDSELLARLKEKLDKKTSGTIDFFLSSDGESIPFGRNWVATLQDALERTKICFVFLTPNSALSSWIYFESGYIYSKKIRVIPVAFPGVDLAKIPPPLGLLQGFNIHFHESLNNILRVLNDEFKTAFSDSFAAPDFDELFAKASLANRSYFGQWTDYIDLISITSKISRSVSSAMEDLLKERGLEYTIISNEDPKPGTKKSITTYGLAFTETKPNVPPASVNQPQPPPPPENERRLTIQLSPDIPESTLGIVDELAAQSKELSVFGLSIRFLADMTLLSPQLKVTSRLHKSGVTIVKTGGYLYQGITFTLQAPSPMRAQTNVVGQQFIPPGHSQGPSISLSSYSGNLKGSQLVNLVGLLIQQGVIAPQLSAEGFN
jgi:hypothetical protein